VRREFAQLKAIAVRDHDSKATLEGLGIANVEVGCDLVFTETPPATEPDDVIAVGLRPPLAGGLIPTSLRQKTHTDRWLLAMAAGLDNAASATGLGIRFIAMDRVRDHAVHEAVAARMRSDAQFDVPDLGSVLTSFGTARVAVGMRYHAAVASLVAGRPAVGLAYSQKVASLTDEAGGAVVSSSLSLDALDDLPAAVTQALAHSYRVSDAVAHQRSRMRVVRDVLARVAA
jgi:polysaccharide pyruvyl transferase WcaK-like protein